MLIHGKLRAAHWGFPFTSDDIRYVVKGYLGKRGRKEKRFSQNLPGMEWSRAFLKRHSNVLSVRLSENIKRQRAEVNHETVKSYFLNIEEAIMGLIPFNPDKVLNKLPDKEHGPSNSADAWSSSFEEMLKSARYGRNSTTNARRRRKLNVPPGRSISSRDLRNGGHNDDLETRRDFNGNERTKRREEDESSEDDIMEQEIEIVQEEEQNRILEEEAFVLVKYPYWKENEQLNRQFVGVAREVGAKEVSVRYLRSYQNSKSVFIFPEVPDDDSVEKHQIVKVLPVP
ncbi:hypothetical protein ANN_03209 [Periplaneta americana]|uniref:Uncharacterized protein n=1 Tax=Periplaneta americana TaxID=6978 RepID=A0ABQ8TYH7_PERAM|nr:hypothetical protein ANN_03209 [Periplaneta americana]